ncbi:MAG: prepilin-type N-terminal cleavage/methylation domain-containing protein [Planctomycetaceae bacterium]|nr:prepilin-type N-terminal cleavage/methylation domain-containing protein [Planctomycetales bacterium]MCB9925909.1 prepilin-type N-terminal cleavage/methylation domain-containing protein [Planctomycetaceae bacterium]
MMRRGVSLLEVMISMGVIAIGLAGVIAILPVALYHIGRGTVLDNASRVGLNAVEEFDLRGMGRPLQWRYRTNLLPDPATARNGWATAFAIDPWFIANNSSDANAEEFPYGTTTSVPRMVRVSLRSSPSGTPSIMGSAQAEEIFVSQDELVFDLPLDRTQPPTQVFGAGTARRQYEGTISWMATVAPVYSSADRDLYTLSVVVFHNRAVTDTAAERVVDVRDFLANGLSGGDITLQGASPDDLELQAGNWIMLMDFISSGVPFFRWYRVVATEESARISGASWQREVTLHGADWPSSLVQSTTTFWGTTPPPAGYVPTRAAIVGNVVAVYEKTIRLETGNLWEF